MTRYVAFVLAALCIAPALADDSTGSVEGILVGDRGKTVAHVTVVLDGTHGLQQTQTDENGHFVFLTVIPGRYVVGSTGVHRLSVRLGDYADCSPGAEIDVSAGLTWHLPALTYGDWPRDGYNSTCSAEGIHDLQQLTTAGTTASLYIINQ